MEYIITVYFVLLTLLQYLLGAITLVLIQSYLPSSLRVASMAQPSLIPFFWFLGLLLHLATAFAAKSVGANWFLATFLPFVPVVFGWRHFGWMFQLIKTSVIKLLNIPFTIWLVLQLFLGASLFSVGAGINTPWMNNYGDLAFHLGMIHHFVLQGDFPPTYHVYAGESLSYPFFVNLWSALLWWPSQALFSLKLAFVFQWLLLWCCVYYFISNARAFFLPWVLLFGGGSYFAIYQFSDTYSWRLIGEGYPWTTWLSTIWVTQRSALMGLCSALAVGSLVLNLHRFDEGVWRYWLAGILLGLSPLVHTHFFVVSALFFGAYLFLPALWNCLKYLWGEEVSVPGVSTPRDLFTPFMALFLPSLLALVFFPFVLGKSSIASFMLGWSVPLVKPGDGALFASLMMWLKNAPQWFLLFFFLWWQTKKHLLFSLVALLFILANTVKLAVWDWDQIKVFLAIFSLLLLLWGTYISQQQLRLGQLLLPSVLALIVVGPGVYEGMRIGYEQPSYQVYDAKKVELASVIAKNVPANSVIASPPEHNSAATLSGRSLFLGYPGTLASHSIVYRERERIHASWDTLLSCFSRPGFDTNYCPEFVIWDSASRKYWHRVNPPQGMSKVASTKDGQYGIYRVEQN